MEGMTGAQFHDEYLRGDREKAKEYLARDILGLYYVAQRVGLLNSAFLPTGKEDDNEN
jgi:hypothetical protein